jgi:putative membrane protein
MTATTTTEALPARLGFLDERAKKRAVLAVQAFERETSAELVITVKKQARTYREVDLAFGALFAFVALLFLLFYPVDFDTRLMPLDTLVAFGFGFGLSRLLPSMRRIVLPAHKRRAAVEEAAKAAFVDLGVTRTTGRTGVLVFVALFERVVAIVADVGVTSEAKRAAEETRGALEAALARSDVKAFAESIESLGPRFGTTMARSADDVNELSDDIA